MHMSKINWAILGGGRVSKVFAETIFKDKNSNLVSIASKTLKNRIYFNKKYNKNFSIFKDYDKILNNPKIDIIYVSLINKLHKEFILKCIKKKKNILVEKPAFLSLNDFVLCKKLLILTDKFGGGAIYDLGCYPIVFSIIIASIFENEVVKLKNFFGFSSKNYLNIDETAYAKIIFNNNVISNIGVSVQKKFKKPTVIKGTKGKILIFNPWTPDKNYKIIVYRNSAKKIYNFRCRKSIYEYQLNYANRQIFMRKYNSKDYKINWDLLENYIKILETWKKQTGLSKKFLINFIKKINLLFKF